jgi:hypothetical protein
MAENIRMDSHKLIYHPETVGRWLGGAEHLSHRDRDIPQRCVQPQMCVLCR